MNPTKLSKFLSLVLRHEPGKIGITLDPQGWVACEQLIAAATAHGMPFDQATLIEVVRTSDKQRFALSADGLRIRANQGHSIPVDLDLRAATPPAILYHGTVDRFLDPIRKVGLIKGERHHVHLSENLLTAEKVGERRGEPIILHVDAMAMAEAGFPFYRTENGVWLTDHVPPKFINFDAA